ncbi:MAG: metalloregulator ArsR/SmtB family transcription factor [Anaerolineaceae bacterium]
MASEVIAIKEEVLQLHAQICSGLADPNRILLIYSLAGGPKNVNEMAKSLDLPQSTVSRHLKVLRERGIVRATRDGQSVIYNLTDERIVQALDLLRVVMANSLKEQAALATSAIEHPAL